MGAAPAMVLTLLAWPRPANRRRPVASCTLTNESAEKLNRKRARPSPETVSVPPATGSTVVPAAALPERGPPGVVPSVSNPEPATRSAGRPSAAPRSPGRPSAGPPVAESPPAGLGVPESTAATVAPDAGPAVAAARRECHGCHHTSAAAAASREMTATPETVAHGGARAGDSAGRIRRAGAGGACVAGAAGRVS